MVLPRLFGPSSHDDEQQSPPPPQGPNGDADSDAFKHTFKYEKNVCALSWWEPIKLLEEGSISDIHLVRRRDRFVKVRYKDKRNVMSFAKKQKPWAKSKTSSSDDQGEEDVYVLKSIMKDHIGDERVLDEMRQEIQTMSKLNHPNICRLVEAYERRRHIYLVMDFCAGGDLFGRCPMEERQAAVCTKKILLAVEYMHGKGVAHRDIKLENIMFDGNGEIKLIDFGLATAYLSDDYKNMTDKVGTLYSMAPQVLEGRYDERCDLWSIGVVSYLLLSGKQPFWGPPTKMLWKDRRKVMIDLIKKCEYAPMTCRSWKIVSNSAKEFVESLLKMNADDRPTASEALEAKWIRSMEYLGPGEGRESFALDEKSSENLKQFSLLRQKLWQLLSTGLSEDEIEGLRAYIEARDDVDDCMISIAVFHEILLEASENSACCESAAVDAVFDGSDGVEGQINYVDFFAEVLAGKGRNTVEELAKFLDELDVRGTRKVPVDDVRPVMAKLPSDMTDDVWNSMHIDEDGMINTSELLSNVTRMMAGRHRESIRSGQCKY